MTLDTAKTICDTPTARAALAHLARTAVRRRAPAAEIQRLADEPALVRPRPREDGPDLGAGADVRLPAGLGHVVDGDEREGDRRGPEGPDDAQRGGLPHGLAERGGS